MKYYRVCIHLDGSIIYINLIGHLFFLTRVWETWSIVSKGSILCATSVHEEFSSKLHHLHPPPYNEQNGHKLGPGI